MANKVEYYANTIGPVSVYVQIENQIQFAIASGKLKPGDCLPSVREMSAMLDVNPNTVTKAYRDLELLQFVNARRGVGVIVTEKAPKIAHEQTLKMVREHLAGAVAECVASGLTAQEVRADVSKAIESGARPYQLAKNNKK